MDVDPETIRAALLTAPDDRSLEDRFRRFGADPDSMIPAAVLMGLRGPAADPELVLTRRVAHLTHHAGQVSFPGGRIDRGDADEEAAALREAEEEIGLHPSRVEVLGRLARQPTATGYVVTPVVGTIADGRALEANPDEVDEVFAVPLGFFADRANRRRRVRTVAGQRLALVEFEYGGQRIWGATAMMILAFIAILEKHGKQ